MPTYTLQIPQVGLPNSTEDPKVASSLTTVQTALSSGLDTSNLTSSAGILLTQLAAGVGRFNAVSASSNVTLTDGQCAVGTGAGVTVTLPSAAAGAWCAVHAGSAVTGASPATVQRAASDVIYGQGLSAATSFVLGFPQATVVMYATFAGQWNILAGQPDTGWVALSLATNWSVTSGCYAPAYRVIGSQAWFRGAATNGTGSTGFQPVTSPLPTAIRPTSDVNIVWSHVASATPGFDLNQILPTGVYGLLNGCPNSGFVVMDGSSYPLV